MPDEIKTICLRVDIPKRLLIQVARQKTDKSIQKTFKKIKEPFINKKKEEPPVRKRSSPLEAAIKHPAHLKTRKKIDQSSLSKTEKESLQSSINIWGLKSKFKISFSNIFIMDTDFAGLCENINNFNKNGIFASGSL